MCRASQLTTQGAAHSLALWPVDCVAVTDCRVQRVADLPASNASRMRERVHLWFARAPASQQNTPVVLLGDRYQQLYSFNHACGLMGPRFEQ
jgi:hypothetical protein